MGFLLFQTMRVLPDHFAGAGEMTLTGVKVVSVRNGRNQQKRLQGRKCEAINSPMTNLRVNNWWWPVRI
jgi:hypothetical protein